MKTNKLLILIGLGVAAWYFMRKTPTGKAVAVDILPDVLNTNEAASEAKTIVADVVDETKFLPDVTTDRQLYNNDLKYCK